MKNILFIALCLSLLSSCSKDNYILDDPLFVYDEFWNYTNDNYIYFDEKNVNWQDVYDKHGISINENSTENDLYIAIQNSLLELEDAHNWLSTPDGVAEVYDITTGFEVHYDPQLVEDKYINGDFLEERIFSYATIEDSILYVRVPDMGFMLTLRRLLREQLTDGNIKSVIIDLRDNSGGDSNDVPNLLGDYVDEKTFLGSYIEKSGPAREDETDDIPVFAVPNSEFNFDQEVILLINRRCFSATSYMAAMCKGLEKFTLVGQVTGGGGGGNAGFELSNGWVVALSVSDFVDKEGKSIELGVEPDEFIENTADDIANGIDKMLEKAIEIAR